MITVPRVLIALIVLGMLSVLVSWSLDTYQDMRARADIRACVQMEIAHRKIDSLDTLNAIRRDCNNRYELSRQMKALQE